MGSTPNTTKLNNNIDVERTPKENEQELSENQQDSYQHIQK